jgi:Rod binding domain-containing protein
VPKIPTDSAISQTGMGLLNSQDINSLESLKRLNPLKGQKTDSPKEVEKATKGFEALLLQQMMHSMFETVDHTGLMGEDSNEADIMRGMFTQAVADEIASGKGIGVKEVVSKEIAKRAGKGS